MKEEAPKVINSEKLEKFHSDASVFLPQFIFCLSELLNSTQQAQLTRLIGITYTAQLKCLQCNKIMPVQPSEPMFLLPVREGQNRVCLQEAIRNELGQKMRGVKICIKCKATKGCPGNEAIKWAKIKELPVTLVVAFREKEKLRCTTRPLPGSDQSLEVLGQKYQLVSVIKQEQAGALVPKHSQADLLVRNEEGEIFIIRCNQNVTSGPRYIEPQDLAVSLNLGSIYIFQQAPKETKTSKQPVSNR